MLYPTFTPSTSVPALTCTTSVGLFSIISVVFANIVKVPIFPALVFTEETVITLSVSDGFAKRTTAASLKLDPAPTLFGTVI